MGNDGMFFLDPPQETKGPGKEGPGKAPDDHGSGTNNDNQGYVIKLLRNGHDVEACELSRMVFKLAKKRKSRKIFSDERVVIPSHIVRLRFRVNPDAPPDDDDDAPERVFIVMRRAPGKMLSDLGLLRLDDSREQSEIEETYYHYRDLVVGPIEQEYGVTHTDFKGDNAMFEEASGKYTLIDCASLERLDDTKKDGMYADISHRKMRMQGMITWMR